jgi:hypothetical protein
MLFLRRPDKITIGLVIPNEDGSFSWKAPRLHGRRFEPAACPANGCYPTEDLAIEALYTALGM